MLNAGEFLGEDALPVSSAYGVGQCDGRVCHRQNRGCDDTRLRDQPTFSQQFALSAISQCPDRSGPGRSLFNSSENGWLEFSCLAHFGKDGKLDPVIPHVNQEILAARVGTTRSRINYFMNKFRKLGFIEYDNGTLNVHSSLLNVIVHD
jgi:hypothetical protein